jgi:DNA-binding NarL/FixJ family response regulator
MSLTVSASLGADAGQIHSSDLGRTAIPPIRLVIADGTLAVRAGLKALLDGEPDLVVVGDAGDGEEALRLAGVERPDLVLVDGDLPRVDALEVTRRIADDPDLAGVRVVILARDEHDDRLFPALRAGASGIVDKTTDPADLVEALRVVASGAALLSPGATERLLTELVSQPQPHVPTHEQLDELTPREREVMTLLASGLHNDQIADRLAISRATAKTHVSRALTKLDVRDRAQLVAVAYQVGLVRPGEATRHETTLTPDSSMVVA